MADLVSTIVAEAPGRDPAPQHRTRPHGGVLSILRAAFRVHRSQVIALAAFAMAATVYLWLAMAHLHALVDQYRALRCASLHNLAPNAACGHLLTQAPLAYDLAWNIPMPVGFAVPVLIGIFVFGVPLVAREHRSKIARLSWTQSRSRTTWLVANLAVAAGAVAVTAAGLSVLGAWWLRDLNGLLHSSVAFQQPYNRTTGGTAGLGEVRFALAGPVLVASTLFALALGTFLGALIRRVFLASIASVGSYAAVLVGIARGLRPNYMPPAIKTGLAAIKNGVSNVPAGSMFLSSGWAKRGSTSPSSAASFFRHIAPLERSCDTALAHPGLHPPVARHWTLQQVQAHIFSCMGHHGLSYLSVYQPPSRYWAFQGIESGILVSLAVVLAVAATIVVRRLSV